jgi:DNA-binding NtrC family response regulator
LAERLKADNPDLKVLYTSGYSTELLGKDLDLHEGTNFLQKPYPPSKLVETVRNALGLV